MGMRANFSKIDSDGTIVSTSVQWSTVVDRILAMQLQAIDEADMQRVMNSVFDEITKYEHISALESLKDAEEYSKMYPNVSTKNFVKVGSVLAVTGAIEDTNDGYSLTDRTATQSKLRVMEMTATEFFLDYHFEDGLSVIYDERFPNFLTFAYESDKEGSVNGVKFERISLENLRNGSETGYNE